MKTFLQLLASVLIVAAQASAQIVRETVFFDIPSAIAMNPQPAPTAQLSAVPGYPADANRMTLLALLYHPDPAVHGPGPYPTVIVLHGSGGMWKSDAIAQGPTVHFQKWGNLLAGRGYLTVIPDGFNPRGIAGGFSNRRPHHDPAIDDAACSPNYERPKDVVAALTWLNDRTDVDRQHIGLLGFSHGSQTGLNAILDPSVDLGSYTEDYIDANGDTVDLAVPAPVRIPSTLPFPKVGIFYYPGCGHFSYHGSPNSMAAGRYMPDRRTQVVMFHGTSDSLMGVTNVNATPKTGSLFPIKFVTASAAQASAEGIANPFAHHHIFDLVGHSFDETTIEPPANWNTAAESANEKANRLAQAETLKWLEYRLHDHALTPQTSSVTWFGRDQLRYQLQTSLDLINWSPQGVLTTGANAWLNTPVVMPPENRLFYRMTVDPVPPPVNDVLYSAFFLEYADFSY